LTETQLSERPTDLDAATGARHFDFYGLRVRVESPGSDAGESVTRDWSWFASEAAPADVVVHMRREAPPFERMPALEAAMITPRNVCYRGEDAEYIDYFGRGLAVYHRSRRSIELWSENPDLLREMAYLYLLSTVGAHLDGIGRHRLHSLGISHGDKGVALLLPSGGGKSTTALRLLQERPDVDILSEDTPLLDAAGTLHPFPLRIGFRPGQETSVPEHHLQTVDRMEFSPKTLVDLDWFADRIASPVPVAAVLIGVRSSGKESLIERIPRRRATRAILANLVVGIGVYQGLEFVLQRSWLEVATKVRPALSRARAGLALLRRARTYRFVLGRDQDDSFRRLEEFLDGELHR